MLRSLVFSLLLVSLLGIVSTPAPAADSFYYKATLESSVNPVTASYIDRAIDRAEREGAAGLILRLNTPGGLMDSMNSITQRILNAEVPVIVWIGPAGARAASAGVFITYASHVAAMAPTTHLGAATPVAGGGGSMGEDMKKKVVNDAVAHLQSLAERRGRNRNLADSFVREAVSITAREALARNVVDLLADSVNELVKKLEGRSVELARGDTVTLTGGLPVRPLKPTWREEVLNTLVNPNLVYILMMLGIYGLIYEFSNPGVGLGGTVGGICLLLSLYGMSVLPLNYAGLGLILLGLSLMVLDVFVPSFGVLTLGGMVSFFLGSLMLFQTPAFSVSTGLIIGVTLATALFVGVVGLLVLGSFNLPSAIGDDSMIGRHGVVKKTLDPEGMVYVWGEYWEAETEERETIEQGEEIEVTGKVDRTLVVRRRSE